MNLERKNGSDINYINSLPSKMSFLHGNGWLSTKVKRLTSHIASPLTAMPKIESNSELWAVKNTVFACQQMLLASASLGIFAAPMEGFDELRLCYALGIPPEEYSIPLVVSLGYPLEEEEAESIGWLVG